ncbi:MAG: hypothetical protein PHQ40_21540 [Anaerolineaceae bacterium]|nr:hypothetical protein [Anaerolineaceae bacterium]
MAQLIPMMIGFPLIGFWFWMFRDLTNNDYLPANVKNSWMLAFIVMNVFAAYWYYLVEYRNRHL